MRGAGPSYFISFPVEIYVWDRKMVLKMVWASLGLILATLGGFQGGESPPRITGKLVK